MPEKAHLIGGFEMPEKNIRIGKVSSIDYENGMISVTYPDLDDSVTDDFPVFSFTGEYKMPQIGEDVLVLHLSNGCSAGVVMGRYWNEDNKPQAYGRGVFRKELGEKPGDAFIQYKDGNITLKDKKNITTLGNILSRLSDLEEMVQGGAHGENRKLGDGADI